eukprot:gene14178-16716_t
MSDVKQQVSQENIQKEEHAPQELLEKKGDPVQQQPQSPTIPSMEGGERHEKVQPNPVQESGEQLQHRHEEEKHDQQQHHGDPHTTEHQLSPKNIRQHTSNPQKSKDEATKTIEELYQLVRGFKSRWIIEFKIDQNSKAVSVNGQARISRNPDHIKMAYQNDWRFLYPNLNDGVHNGTVNDPRIALVFIDIQQFTYSKEDLSYPQQVYNTLYGKVRRIIEPAHKEGQPEESSTGSHQQEHRHVFKNMDDLLEGTLKIVKMGIISEAECKSIMKRRQEFEYKLAARECKKADFLRYIKYELELDTMLHKRAKDDNIEFDYRLRDPLRHSLVLFSCAVHKFNKDEALWISYLNLRVSRTSKEGTGKVFGLALQNLPRSPRLWRLAAAFEFEVNRNIKSARSLIQLGIQYNPNDRSLWHYFFTMELSYISVLINAVSNDAPLVCFEACDQDLKETVEVDESLLTEVKKEEHYISFGKEIFNADTLKNSSVLQGKIAVIVYNTAIKKIKDDFGFRKEFHTITAKFVAQGKMIPSTSKTNDTIGEIIQREIIQSMKTDFSTKDNRIWFLLAANETGQKSTVIDASNKTEYRASLDKAITVLDEGLLVLNNEEYVLGYYKFLIKQMSRVNASIIDIIQLIEKKLLAMFQSTMKLAVLKEAGLLQYVELLVQTGRLDAAMELAGKATTQQPQSIMLWNQRINLLIKYHHVVNAPTADSNQLLEQCFTAAIKLVQTNSITQVGRGDECFFVTYFDHKMAQCNMDIKKILPLFKSTIKVLDGKAEWQDAIKLYLIDYLFVNGLASHLKETYTLCFQYLPISREFFQRCILYQQARVNPDINEIRSLYERYFQEKSFAQTDDKSWLNYRNFELRTAKDINKSNIITHRARKALLNPSKFIANTGSQ